MQSEESLTEQTQGSLRMEFQEINIPSPLLDFITAHEIHCVAHCCGEDAFDFTPAAIAENQWTEDVIAELDLDQVEKQLQDFRRRATTSTQDISNSHINIQWVDENAINHWCDLIGALITNARMFLHNRNRTKDQVMNRKLENATGLYLEGIRDGNFRLAILKYSGDRYTQHSTGIKDGQEGFIEFFEEFAQRNTSRDIRVVRSIVDGQYVFVQVYQNLNNGEALWVTTDLFDTDGNDKMIEHWDVISALNTKGGPENNQLDGPTEIVDLSETENNKETVRNFLRDVMVLGKAEQIHAYIDLNILMMHRAPDVSPITEEVGSYNQVFKIIGQGNFVVSYSRVLLEEKEFARFDLFRLKNGRIEELWTNQEMILPKEEWANGGKF